MSHALTIEMVSLSCGVCGIQFMLPRSLYVDRERQGEEIYCPSGHALEYGPHDADDVPEKVVELRTQLMQALHRAEQAEARATEVRGSNDATSAPEAERPLMEFREVAGCPDRLQCPRCEKSYRHVARLMTHLTAVHRVDDLAIEAALETWAKRESRAES